jgi:FkbM family methyltransferase
MREPAGFEDGAPRRETSWHNRGLAIPARINESFKEMKRLIKRMTRHIGYDIVRYDPKRSGANPYEDMARFLRDSHPVIFDVGANVGQSIQLFRSRFPGCVVHSFEPSPTTFETLMRQTLGLKDLHLWNCALGSAPGRRILLENLYPDHSSFLPIGERGYGEVKMQTPVEVRTVDQLCRDEGVERIDVLKSDTQGFELEVFKGAEATIRASRIGLIYFEVIFSELYRGLPPFAELFEFLTERGFHLVSFYDFRYEKHLASETDALFVHRSFLPGKAPGQVR